MEPITPQECAALILCWLEKRGAIFTLNADETFMCDLDPMAESDFAKLTTEMVAHVVLGLKEEIRQILLSRRIVH